MHSDNGNPMKGVTLVGLFYQLGIVPSYSKPRVSDDNPFIESFFKTLKYKSGYPKKFDSIESARKWFADFVDWYKYITKYTEYFFIFIIKFIIIRDCKNNFLFTKFALQTGIVKLPD